MIYLIYSYRQRQWWKADKQGYTKDRALAGQYMDRDAGEIMLHGLPGANVAVDLVLSKNHDVTVDTVEEHIDTWRRL